MIFSQLFRFILNFLDNINDWRLIGQEKDGSFLFSWVQDNRTDIGIYNYQKNTLKKIYSFRYKTTCIQASISSDETILVFVIKENSNNDPEYKYKVFLYKTGDDFEELFDLNLMRPKQIMAQFLYPRQSILSENQPIKLLVLIHQEGTSASLYIYLTLRV